MHQRKFATIATQGGNASQSPAPDQLTVTWSTTEFCTCIEETLRVVSILPYGNGSQRQENNDIHDLCTVTLDRLGRPSIDRRLRATWRCHPFPHIRTKRSLETLLRRLDNTFALGNVDESGWIHEMCQILMGGMEQIYQ